MFRPADLRDALPALAAAAALALALSAPAPLAAQADRAADAAGQQAPALSVEGAVLTTGVRNHMPVDTLSTVPAEVGRAFLWTRITGAEGTTTVTHVWYRGEEEAARVSLPVNSPDWRTYSTKRILSSWTGPWRVEIRDATGQVLQTVNFNVQPTGATG